MPEDKDNGLVAGKNYEAVLIEEEVGKVLYLGVSYKNCLRWSQNSRARIHLIAFKNKVGGIQCRRFYDNEYELLDGKLRIRVPFKQKISPLERKFIEDRLNTNNQ